jgi:hypothetical protein
MSSQKPPHGAVFNYRDQQKKQSVSAAKSNGKEKPYSKVERGSAVIY